MASAPAPALSALRAHGRAISEHARNAPAALLLGSEAVSRWSIAEQYDHILKVASAILDGLLEPGSAPGAGLNWTGRAVLLTGWIPRGRARVPEGYGGMPVGAGELIEASAALERRLEQVERDWPGLPRAPIWRHPMLGGMTAAQSLRFTAIHSAHHLAIVHDIRKTTGTI